MVRLFIYILFFIIQGSSFSQDIKPKIQANAYTATEFGESENGLIYSDQAIGKLKAIIDSLHLKFKACDLNKVYYSKSQVTAHYIKLQHGNIKKAQKDIEANISFKDFIKKYPKSEVGENLLVVKYEYSDQNKDMVEFFSIDSEGSGAYQFSIERKAIGHHHSFQKKWIHRYEEKSVYSEEFIEAFYFTEEFSTVPLPEKYARMVQYSDCMVDTSSHIFYEKVYQSDRKQNDNPSSKVEVFMNYIHRLTDMPQYPQNDEKTYEVYMKEMHLWDSLRLSKVKRIQSADINFNSMLAEAVKDATANGGTGNEFEEYVGLYYSKESALELKRNRKVIGACSMDRSPRIHALNIAKLSAETVNWQIFLRAHLDIMNDRFERTTDGSYAWKDRKTYIKELEVLDINVPDLLLGITLRLENPSSNHYYGSVDRLGRALSETNQSIEIEEKMLQMISDKWLDNFNRIIIYYLFLSYNNNVSDKQRQIDNNEKLMVAVKTLPGYLTKNISKK
jgi:hypothetical protein